MAQRTISTTFPSPERLLDHLRMVDHSISVRSLAVTPHKPKVKNKYDQAKALFVAHQAKPRSEVITLMVEMLGLTRAGATTYYSKIKKGA